MALLHEKSYEKLELHRVLELLAKHAISQAAKEACMAIVPDTDADEVRHLLRQTTASCQLITLKGAPSFSAIQDVGASLDRAHRGGVLSPRNCFKSHPASVAPAM